MQTGQRSNFRQPPDREFQLVGEEALAIDVVRGRNISIFQKMRFFINAVTFDPDVLEKCNCPHFYQ